MSGRLGQRASHGCVRLHPTNAATLYNLVKQRGMASTRIIVGYGGSRNVAELGSAPKTR